MKISGIDKDFVNIINYLDKKGFKPFSSCDGVLANHENPKSVSSAYIAFLKSPQIIDLMAAFLRDKDTFEVEVSSDDHIEPHYYYDNLITGNRYMVAFLNKSGNFTSYFEEIIMRIAEGRISVSDDEKKDLNTLSDILEANENSDLEFNVIFNTHYQPFMNKEGRINVLRVRTKEGYGYDRNMHSLVDILNERYGIIKKIDNPEEIFEEDEFTCSFFDGSTAEVYFTDEHTKEIQELIEKIRGIGPILPTIELKDIDYDAIDYDDIDYDDIDYDDIDYSEDELSIE